MSDNCVALCSAAAGVIEPLGSRAQGSGECCIASTLSPGLPESTGYQQLMQTLPA